MSLGAKLLKAAEERPPTATDNFQVYADPAGHPFCLCWLLISDDPEAPQRST